MMISYYPASLIAHYHTFNIMAAVFSDGTLGVPQTASLSHPDI